MLFRSFKAFIELMQESKSLERSEEAMTKMKHAFIVAELMPPAAQRRLLEWFIKEKSVSFLHRLVKLMTPLAHQFCADTVVASEWLCKSERELWEKFASLASERGQRQAFRDFLRSGSYDLARVLTDFMPPSTRQLCAKSAVVSDGLRRADSELWLLYLDAASAKQLARAFAANHSDTPFASLVYKRAMQVEGGEAALKEIAARVRVHAFAEAGDVELLEAWLRRGAPIDAVRDRGALDTPLLAAVSRGQAACVRVLIERGADVERVRKPSGENVFHVAADAGDLSMTRQLLYNLRKQKKVLKKLLSQPTAFGRAPAHCTKNSQIRQLLTDASRGLMPSDLEKEKTLPPPPKSAAEQVAAARAAAKKKRNNNDKSSSNDKNKKLKSKVKKLAVDDTTASDSAETTSASEDKTTKLANQKNAQTSGGSSAGKRSKAKSVDKSASTAAAAASTTTSSKKVENSDKSTKTNDNNKQSTSRTDASSTPLDARARCLASIESAIASIDDDVLSTVVCDAEQDPLQHIVVNEPDRKSVV